MDIPAEENTNLHEENVMKSSYQSSSAVKETAEANKPLVCDNTPDTVTNNVGSPENIPHYQDTAINSFNSEEVQDNVENNDSEAMTVTKIDLEGIQDSKNISESVSTEEHPQVGSVAVPSNVQVTGQMNAPSSEQVPQGEKDTQSSEYASEYMLEHHTENVYMPEQAREQVNSDTSEQAYSTDIISDDSHDKKREYEKVQVEKPSAAEGVTERVVDNFVSEYQAEFEHEENMNSSYEESPAKSNDHGTDGTADENDQGAFTIDLTSSNNESETCDLEKSGGTVDEIDNQNVNESTEVYISDTSINEEGTGEGINSDIGEAEPVNPPIEHIAEGVEDVEDVEMAQVADPLSENVESYTIPDDLEVTVQDGGYTMVEGPSSLELSTSQHEDTNTDGTLVLLENYEHSEEGSLAELADDQDAMYLTELRSQSESRQSTSSQSSDVKPRRGRKPTYEIPMHVLGHDISKPVESVPNGRAIPKPRLGVKVPYRNLTSQIVSKAEIEKEIMERARIKQEQASSRGDILFARKLTQRLARKIAPSPDRPRRVTAQIKSPDPVATPQSKPSESKVTERKETENPPSQSNSMIENDSDLLAILEGEGEEMPVLPKEVPQPQIDESNLKMLEREIALQQLQELPHQTPKQRIFRGRQVKLEAKAPVLIAEASALSKLKSTDKTALAAKQSSTSTSQPSQPLSNKENTTSKQPIAKEGASVSPRKEQINIDVTSPKRQPIEIEPQVKVNMVLKTYSRKRKTIDLPESLADSPVPKRAMLDENEIKAEKPEPAATTDVYVTKSSRVIKKKVIWDPDEIPSRSPKHASKPEVQTAKIVIKSTKPVEKNLNVEKVPDKKPTSEKVVKEKPVEKKSNEKVPTKRIVNEKAASPAEKKTPAPKTDSPKVGKNLLKNKKLRSEVDRLLMDEGAVKMLYDLKNNEETAARKKKDVYSVEKAHKEIIKKANLIKNDLEQNTSNESPKSLRKKEALTPSPVKPVQITALTERKMSKDSTRSSVHTPPGSPAYSFPHSQSSMLVRRRSSSSISSSDEIDTNDEARVTKKKPASSSSDTPKPKKIKKVEEIKEPIEPEIPDVQSTPKPAKLTIAENKLNQYKSFTVKKMNRHATINLNYANEKCYCTVQVLDELTAALKKIAKDKDCNVVSITSNSKAFCLGLDYTSLISDEEDVRRTYATELAERVRDFLLCLLNFPKVLVAGIQGDCIGLGVTMLPLFDMVIASDTATFSTPYASLGCIAEAGFLLSSPNLSNHGLAAELLFTTQKLTADDAFRRGLISRLCWPEKYNETLKNLLVSIAKGSKQCLEATKKQLRRHVVQITEAAIKSDTKLLIEHWISPECQKNFARVNENGN